MFKAADPRIRGTCNELQKSSALRGHLLVWPYSLPLPGSPFSSPASSAARWPTPKAVCTFPS